MDPQWQTIMSALKKVQHREHVPDFLRRFGLRRICEVGVERGKNFQILLRAGPTLAVAVDAWRNDGQPAHNDSNTAQETLDSLHAAMAAKALADSRIRVQRMWSAEAAASWPDASFDYVYVDADHTYDGVRDDLRCWFPKVRAGGVLAGHDYRKENRRSPIRFGVVQAVTEFLQAHGLQEYFHVSAEKWPSWFVLKIK
jgi:hypothetical protein